MGSIHYFPLAWPLLLLLFLLVMMSVALIELHVLKYAYERMGLKPRYVLAILLLSLFGSYINIPIARMPAERVVSQTVIADFFGDRYLVPTVHQWPGTVVAINVGGALIPALLSLYLIIRNELYIPALTAVAVVAAVVHHLAHVVRGMGITVPTLIPPLTAAAVAMVLSWRRAPPLAYIAGSLGTLIGADLLNLDKLHGLGSPFVSIGGAGTFDGVFLTGIIAGLLPPVTVRPKRRKNQDKEST